MCDYGIASKNKPIQEYLQDMDQAIKTYGDTICCLSYVQMGVFLTKIRLKESLWKVLLIWHQNVLFQKFS